KLADVRTREAKVVAKAGDGFAKRGRGERRECFRNLDRLRVRRLCLDEETKVVAAMERNARVEEAGDRPAAPRRELRNDAFLRRERGECDALDAQPPRDSV